MRMLKRNGMKSMHSNLSYLFFSPKHISCPHCKSQTVTEVKNVAGTATILSAGKLLKIYNL